MSDLVYPISEARVRPFRIYHEQKRVVLKGRCFGIALNAHNQALIYAKWYLPIGETLAVLDSKGRLLGQYTRKLHTVGYRGPENVVEVAEQQRRGFNSHGH